jgi:hypothetical protein
MKRCLRLFERLWRVEPDKEHAPGTRRLTVGAFENIVGCDQVSYERRFEQLIDNSSALEAVLDQVERVAPTDSTVLIQGTKIGLLIWRLTESTMDVPLVFLPHLRRAEEGIAAKIKWLATAAAIYPSIDFEKAVAWCEQRTERTLARASVRR